MVGILSEQMCAHANKAGSTVQWSPHRQLLNCAHGNERGLSQCCKPGHANIGGVHALQALTPSPATTWSWFVCSAGPA